MTVKSIGRHIIRLNTPHHHEFNIGYISRYYRIVTIGLWHVGIRYHTRDMASAGLRHWHVAIKNGCGLVIARFTLLPRYASAFFHIGTAWRGARNAPRLITVENTLSMAFIILLYTALFS